MWVRLNGRRFQHIAKPLRGDCHGYCDTPSKPNPQVVVDSNLTGKEAMRVRFHEWMHGQMWWISEEYIDMWSRELTDAAWADGYRKEAE